MAFRKLGIAFFTYGSFLLSSPIAHASCLASAAQQVTFELLSCETVDLGKLHPPSNWKNLSSYQGVVLEVDILPNDKNKSPSDKRALIPQAVGRTRVFLADKEKNACHAWKPGVKRTGTLSWACCDGDPNAPCLLGFAEYVYDLKEVAPSEPR